MTHHLIINLWILHKLYSSTKALRTRVFPYSICQCILIFHFFFTPFRTEALLLVPLVKFLDWNLLWRGLPLFSASAGKVNSFDLWRFCVQFFKLKITAWAQSFLHPCLQMNSFRFDSLRFFASNFCVKYAALVFTFIEIYAPQLILRLINWRLCCARNRKTESKPEPTTVTQSLFKLSSSAAKAKFVSVLFL